MTDDPNKMMQKDRDADEKLRHNLSVDADDDSVGSGRIGVNVERADQIALAKEKERKRKEEGHSKTMLALQSDIANLQNQLAEIQEQIAAKERELERLRLDKERTDRQITENRERIEQMRRDGEENTPAYIALVAETGELSGESEEFSRRIERTQEELSDLREQERTTNAKLEGKRREVESLSSLASQERAIEESRVDEAIHIALSENQAVKEMAENEVTVRQNKGEAIENNGSDSVEDRLDTLFASAEGLEINRSFNIAAIGHLEIPTQEQTQDITMPSVPINTIPMG
ncbi:MAG: hypothetical protein DHS20C09_04550 [marine bacterium B5-7]|nr:MAG: hypothetical protein DHS20C09_04550 [marine bacterium B5-7]